MKLMVATQYLENYGDDIHTRWKHKGGWDYCVARLSYQEAAALGFKGMDAMVQELVKKFNIVYANNMAEEYLLDWSLEEDNFITHDEELQLEYEGKITHPHKDFTLLEMAA